MNRSWQATLRERGVAWVETASPTAQAQGLAETVATALRDALASRGEARLALSGGRSPVPVLQALACQVLDCTLTLYGKNDAGFYFLANGSVKDSDDIKVGGGETLDYSVVTMDKVNEWIFQPGLPSDAPNPTSDAFDKVDTATASWLKGD